MFLLINKANFGKFKTIKDKVYMGAISLNLIKKYNLRLPFFLYDSDVIKKQFLELKKFLPSNFQVFYSVKANPNTHILNIFKKLGAGVEISSAGELLVVFKAGFSRNKIIFTGPGKTDEELKMALGKKIYLIIAESIRETERIEKFCQRLNTKQNLLLRINPSFSIHQSFSMFPMAGGGQKFGIDEEKLPALINLIKKLRYVNLLGLHLFPASNIFDEKIILKNTEHLFKLTNSLESKFKINLPIVDIGGGLAVNYSTDAKFNVKNLYRGLTSLTRKYRFGNKKILLESGRFLVGEAGGYIAEVVDKKVSRRERFVVINGGVNHISRATLAKDNHKIEVLGRGRSMKKEIVNVVGNLNTPTDFITRALLPKIEIGDLISIKNVGAYGLTSGMLLFSSRPVPREYLLLDGKLKMI